MEVSGKRTNLPSNPCEICQTHEAEGFCRECTENMCKECFDHHVKAKPCRHHELCSLDQDPVQIPRKAIDKKCGIYRNENLKYYCQKHEVVGCGDCMISDHDGCKPKLISNLATNFEESGKFKDKLRKIEEYDAECKENMKRVKNDFNENKEMFEKALAEIRKFRKDINDYLDIAEKTIIAEANMYSKENESLLSELQTKIADVSQKVDAIRNKLDTNMHQGVDLFIRMVECKPRISKVDQSIAEIKLSNTIKAYTFKPEQSLKDLLTSKVKFGNMELVKSEDIEQDQTAGAVCEVQANSENINLNKPTETKRTVKQGNRNLSSKNVQSDSISEQTSFKEEQVGLKDYPTLSGIAEHVYQSPEEWNDYKRQLKYEHQPRPSIAEHVYQSPEEWNDYKRQLKYEHQPRPNIAEHVHQSPEEWKDYKRQLKYEHQPRPSIAEHVHQSPEEWNDYKRQLKYEHQPRPSIAEHVHQSPEEWKNYKRQLKYEHQPRPSIAEHVNRSPEEWKDYKRQLKYEHQPRPSIAEHVHQSPEEWKDYKRQLKYEHQPRPRETDYSQAWVKDCRQQRLYHQADAIHAQYQAKQGEEEAKGKLPPQ